MTEGQIPPSSNVNPAQRRGRNQHRSESRWQIYFPIALTGLVVAIIFVLVAFLPQRLQVALIADWMITLLVLCPMVLCLFPIVLLATIGAYGAGRLHDSVVPPLERVEELTATMNERVTAVANNANERVIKINTRLAPVLHWMHRFMGDERITDETNTSTQEKKSS